MYNNEEEDDDVDGEADDDDDDDDDVEEKERVMMDEVGTVKLGSLLHWAASIVIGLQVGRVVSGCLW